MKPFRKLGETIAPDGSVLSLVEHDGAYLIRVNGVDLMSTRRHHADDVQAELVCAPLHSQRGARALIGGLGLGFTLKAALAQLMPDARVLVAEPINGVIEWNQNAEYSLAGTVLSDPRVELRHDDVTRVLRHHPATFDAIVLDADHGVDARSSRGDRRVQQQTGVHLAAAALRPGGRVSYWLATPDQHFEDTLRYAGLVVTTTSVRAHRTSGPYHTIFVGERENERALKHARSRVR